MVLVRFLVLCLGFLACSHDAKRENPFDPALTPAVELAAALDDTSGTVTLSWAVGWVTRCRTPTRCVSARYCCETAETYSCRGAEY